MQSPRDRANALRALAMDAVQQANSGHPGAPMGMADFAEVLWNRFLSHNPHHPRWINRDRVVLSNGHASMLLYGLLHLSGYDLPLEQLKQFRQLHSQTPGHPELGETAGVETTTGPLGQGVANGVGFALAEQLLAAEYNRPDHAVIDHFTYVLAGDGCLMEGISHEACSLAGTLGLGKLIVLYDDNGISIDGAVDHWFADDTKQRFIAYRWQVIGPIDGHDAHAVETALTEARAELSQPTLIICKTLIGYGSPNKAGTADTHGAPLGAAEIAATREALGWSHPPFHIPAETYAAWDAKAAGEARENEWNQRFARYAAAYPDLAATLERRLRDERPAALADAIQQLAIAWQLKPPTLATRVASQQVLAAIGPTLPELFGGSADLSGSNGTLWKGCPVVTPELLQGQYLSYGVREFAMAAMQNGLALHGGFIPYGGTFLVFSDYARNAIRLSALMGCRSIFVLTHDSIALGEAGPTHQPVEHLWSLRLIPRLRVWRPADARETLAAWDAAIAHDGPSCLVLTRQNLAPLPSDHLSLDALKAGGYVVGEWGPGDALDGLLIATGSEVALALAAASLLASRGQRVRVVSLPCVEAFEAQSANLRDAVLPPTVTRRVVIEVGVTRPWRDYAGLEGKIIGLDDFGASAPGNVLLEHFGFTPAAVVAAFDAIPG